MGGRMMVAVGVGAMACVAAVGVVAMRGAAADGDGGSSRAVLRDASGVDHGSVTFLPKGALTEVRVRLVGLPEAIARDAFHGFHLHANNDPANGEGCLADAVQASSTWFTAVDGHWKADVQVHSSHVGDLPSVLVLPDGRAEMRFVTGRIDTAQLRGRAVVLHAGADNFGNVPVGTGATQYTANTAAAVTATQNTGNAGDRLLCGVIGR